MEYAGPLSNWEPITKADLKKLSVGVFQSDPKFDFLLTCVSEPIPDDGVTWHWTYSDYSHHRKIREGYGRTLERCVLQSQFLPFDPYDYEQIMRPAFDNYAATAIAAEDARRKYGTAEFRKRVFS